MVQEYFSFLPENLVYFLLVSISSLLIGLSQRRLILARHDDIFYFGSDRTFALIGILGFLLHLLDNSFILFGGGGLVLALFLSVSYFFKIQQKNSQGMTTMLIALITYCLGPIAMTQPLWMFILVVVATLLITELKQTFINLAMQLNENEFVTLAKFLFISGIVLPILPRDQVIPNVNLTPYSIWLATVVVSTISYAGYLLKKFVFKDSGIVLSGILGGLYSSTATIIILGKKCKTAPDSLTPKYAAAILMAISMMYLRVLVLTFIFSSDLFGSMILYFIVMIFVAGLAGTGCYLFGRNVEATGQGVTDAEDKNPLEFKVALIFAVLFIIFTLVTHYTIIYLGERGLTGLSIIVGVTDITPFLLNLFQGHYPMAISVLAAACIRAIMSNNIVNFFYSMVFSGNKKSLRKYLIPGFGLIVLANIITLIFI